MENKGSRYRIERELGRGAFGVVYLARDASLDRMVALKVLSVPDGISDEERRHLVDRFHREARAAAGLTHPNIVVIHDISRSYDRHFISMEFLEGKTLADAIESGMEPERAFAVAEQILSALEYAHSRDVVHRDIKPDNIFLLEGDTVKLVDFGLARVQSASTLTRTGTVVGSPGYIAPEIIKGSRADARSDIFSFGVVLYEMLTGSRPFGPSGETDSLMNVLYMICTEDPPPPCAVRDGLPAGTDELVARCLAKEPEDRPANAAEAREQLREVAGAAGFALGIVGRPDAQAPLTSKPRSAASWLRAHRVAALATCGGVLLALVLALLGAFVFFREDPDAPRARRYMRSGDELKASAEEMAPALEKEVAELESGVDSGAISNLAQFSAQADSVNGVIDEIIDKGDEARQAYDRIDLLRGVEHYKAYARYMVEVIDLATASLQKTQDMIDYLRFCVAAVEKGQQVDMVEYANRLQEGKDAVRELNAKVLKAEKQAETLKKDNDL